MPEWTLPILLQLPLVVGVAFYFDRREKKLQADHQAELKRRTDTLTGQIQDWRTLYSQERSDRISAEQRLAAAVSEIKDAASRIEDLTKEVIRHGSRT